MTATRVRRSLAQLTGPVVVDASVAVEYLIILSLTAPAQALFRAAVDRDVELWAPDLLYPESVAAVRRLLRLRAISPNAAGVAIEHLVRLPLMIASSKGLMKRVWELRAAITPYDACYAALAEALRAPFITADRRLVRSLVPSTDTIFLGDLD